jgi:hypothetical protein
MLTTAHWFLIGIIVLFAIVARVQYPRFVRRRYFFYALVAIVSAIGFYIDLHDLWGDPDKEWQITIFLGSNLIVLGWIFTNEISLSNSRKQHTITLITTFVTSAQRVADKQEIRSRLPRAAKLTGALVNYDDENNDLIQSIDRELNFFEFIAIGVLSGDLEEAMAKRMLSGVVTGFIEQVRDYIDYWRGLDSETWENVCTLYDRWKSK